MDKSVLSEVMACLPRGRTLFHYFKDRYALMLLAEHAGCGIPVACLKKSAASRLLSKPVVKDVLASCGKTIVDETVLNSYWPDDVETFLLTLDEWGGGESSWQQTTRDGLNLVLQLNFSNRHDSLYQRMVRPEYSARLNLDGHPVLYRGKRKLFRETLAWSRIDLDFETGEALVEEIQSDWVRMAQLLRKRAKLCADEHCDSMACMSVSGSPENVMTYVDLVLAPYGRIWDEAMMSATIDFIFNEMGIKTVYYHSYETGASLKSIRSKLPPRSIYSRLPKQFCFEKTIEVPEFLTKDKSFHQKYSKLSNPGWYRLAI